MTRVTPWLPTTLFPSARLDEFFDRFMAPYGPETTGVWSPRVDLKETPTDYVVALETPGVDPKDIQVTMNGNTVDVHGEKRREEKRNEDNWRISERYYGSFDRSISFPTPVMADSVKAESKDGVLLLTVKKQAVNHSKKIEIHRK